MKRRVVFMGTPGFALPALRAIVESGGYGVVGVVTQPDRPRGRGRKPLPPPVKEAAMGYGLPVLQPETLRDAAAVRELAALRPEVVVVAAFGQILPPPVLELPPFGCLNVHASLLPRHRGAAPIETAILEGDSETGITVMKMEAGLDTGGILARRATPIAPDDTAVTLTDRLALMGAELLMETLPRWLGGELEPEPQDESLATYAPRFQKEDALADWSRPAEEIARRVRAFAQMRGVYTCWGDLQLRILRAGAVPYAGDEPPGTVFEAGEGAEKGIAVVTGEGALLIEEIQAPGRRPMPARDYARGARGFVGSLLM